ncbi:MAG: DUF1801 domain-containing protein [Cyclobacteriaceae bacterium]|nr:DUF1801 domain-containing protein [Cyclobacteriaceae bacterium]
MLRDIDNYYLNQEEPTKSCMLALRDIILALDEDVTEAWKYRMPMFCYKGKMFCYLWTDKKTRQPYIGVVEGKRINHPKLEQGDRSRMKILRINPSKDLPLKAIHGILGEALNLYKKGIVKIK